MQISTQIAHFKEPLYLESGRILSSFSQAYETYGTLNDDKSNVIVLCHALTGSHHAAGMYEGDRKPGWWDALVGDDKVIDTKKYFVICINVLGSCFGSTGPMSKDPKTNKPYRLKFPVITISDMVAAQKRLLNYLGIDNVYAIIGGSLGGMQALCYSVEYPDFAKKVILLASTYATRPWAIAFNKIAIESIVNDKRFNNGNYDPKDLKENPLVSLSIGRMAGHLSFLSPYAMDKKFGRHYLETDGLYELFGRFQVERYLEYNGYNFAKNFDPLSYLYIVKAMNIFDATRNYESLTHSLSHVKAKLNLFAFKGDLLFLPHEMEEIQKSFEELGRGGQVNYVEIDSRYGHDGFLVEYDKFDMYLKKALEG
ncbi:MAG: homoserine O-acetyltransferase [Proteobacteria bacterium]|nr:MAG: homoserine O-acetyltransferase [Pseudomonadota bacterium]